jgi:hypothetical protein
MQGIDLYRAASEMIKQHGENATIEAAMKSDAMMARGDMKGAKVWREIVKRITILQDQKMDGVTQH